MTTAALPIGRLAWWTAALVAALTLVAAGRAGAQPDSEPPPHALTGTLKRIKEARTVHVGVRAAALPFAAIGAGGQAHGYSVDLCLAIVDDIAAAIGVQTLHVEFRRVTPADRIDQVVDGRIDLECGATTNTAERRTRVAFSPPTFIAGTQLLVRRGSPVRSLRDLAARTVVVVAGTTNEVAMRRLLDTGRHRFALVAVDDYPAAVAMVTGGQAAALAADDVLLAGYVAQGNRRRELAIVGEPLSYEPYGIVYAKGDAALDEVVHATFVRLATTREIRAIYNTWFVRPLPSGVRLRWPMSPPLARSFELLGLPPD